MDAQALKNLGSGAIDKLKHMSGGHAFSVATGLYFAASDYREMTKSGTNPLLALGMAGFVQFTYATMGFLPALAVIEGPKIASAAISGMYSRYKNHEVYMRKALTPFSQSFYHTDMTLRAQQRGMQALGRGQSYLGSEAGLMAQNYTRR